MINILPLPAYSLADLFRDINNGIKNEFTYYTDDTNGVNFTVKRNGFTWVITEPISGFTATTKTYVGSMLDLQGLASCILYYNRSIVFDKDGNLIN